LTGSTTFAAEAAANGTRERHAHGSKACSLQRGDDTALGARTLLREGRAIS
jgi:hypothetical protein